MAAKRNPKQELNDTLKQKQKPTPQDEGQPVSELGLTEAEINALYFQFQPFREGWDDPNMASYGTL